MSNLQLYNPNNVGLGSVSFIQKTFDLVRLDKVERRVSIDALSTCMLENILHLGIKDVAPALITDINEMILMRFRELSLDEVYYAFKLYRYGLICDELKSYGQFNTIFVQKLLSGYKDWKITEIRKNNIKNEKEQATLTDEEKELQVLLGVKRAYSEYLGGRDFGVGYYLYDYLNEKGYVSLTRQEKLKALDSARLKMVGRVNDRREQGERIDLKTEIQRINNKLDGDVIALAKTESLKQIFEKWKQQGKKAENIPTR